MRTLKNLPLGRKLTLITLIASGAALLFTCIGFAAYEVALFRRSMASEHFSVARMLGENSASALTFNDPESAAQTLKSVAVHSHVVAAALYDKDGNVFATYLSPDAGPTVLPRVQPDGHRWGPDTFEYFHGINLAGEKTGTVYVRSDLGEMRERLLTFAGIGLGVLLIAGVVAYTLVRKLQPFVTGPVSHLAEVATKVAAGGNYGVRAVKQSDDELGQLVGTFNAMLDKIEHHDRALREAHDQLEARVQERTRELQQENAERQRSEAALRESHQRFEIVTRATSDAVWDWDVPTSSLWWNENFQTMFGYPAEAVPRTVDGWAAFIHPDDLAPVSDSLHAAFDGTGTLWAAEYRFRRRDGSYAFIFDRGYILRDVKGKPVRIIGAMQDISERKLAQDTVLRERARFKFIFDSVPVGISSVVPGDHATHLANPAHERITGVPAEESRHADAYARVSHPEDYERQQTLIEPFLRGETDHYSIEKRYLHRDGSVTWASLTSRMFVDPTSGLRQIVTTLVDVTEVKAAQEKAAREQARFKFIFEAVPVGFSWMIRGQLDSRIANPAHSQITGVPMERCRELELYQQATHPEDRVKQQALHAALVAGKIDHYSIEKRYLHADGSTRWALLTVKFYQDVTTGETQEISTAIDLTDRKHAEEELRWKTAFLEALVESPLFGLRVVDPNGKKIFQNQRTVELWKIPPATDDDEDAQLHFLSQIERPAAFLGRLKNIGHNETTQDEIKLRDGTIIDRYSAPVTGKDGKYYGRIFAYKDITERKRAETKLAETSALLETLLENAPDFIYFKDRDSRFVQYSGALSARFQHADHEELRGKTDFDLYTEAHARPAFEDEQRIIRTGTAIVGQLEKETYEDGSFTWALTTKMPWRNAEGEIVGTFGISKDVTALKEAEAKAAYERDLLQTLLDKLPDTIYFKDRQSRFVRVSRSQAEHAWKFLRARHDQQEADGPLPLPDHLGSIETTTQWLIGKTDFDTFGDEVARAAFDEEQTVIRSGLPVVGRLEQVKLPDGTVVWFLVNKMPWRDKDGEIIGTFGSSHNITPIKEAETKLAETHKQLLETSRQAGMAEVATGVLHNVGNVLNSVNVSSTLLGDIVRQSKIDKVAKLAELLVAQQHDLATFFQSDPRGQKVPSFVQALAAHLLREKADILKELEALRKNIEHIKDIVAMQQNYAKVSGVCETVAVVDLVEDALRMNSGALQRHDVSLVRDFQAAPRVSVEKHKVLQILINLMRNAKYACDESGRTDKQMLIRVQTTKDRVKIDVVDNGVGIPPENLTRIFSHGFTTRKHGHGFGLHSCALAARELGGSLIGHSDGPGHGATFTLELPYQSDARAA